MGKFIYLIVCIMLHFVQVLLLCSLASLMELVRSGWMMSNVVEMSPDSWTALVLLLAPTTVCTVKMLECSVIL